MSLYGRIRDDFYAVVERRVPDLQFHDRSDFVDELMEVNQRFVRATTRMELKVMFGRLAKKIDVFADWLEQENEQ